MVHKYKAFSLKLSLEVTAVEGLPLVSVFIGKYAGTIQFNKNALNLYEDHP